MRRILAVTLVVGFICSFGAVALAGDIEPITVTAVNSRHTPSPDGGPDASPARGGKRR